MYVSTKIEKLKIRNMAIQKPALVTIGIGLAIMFAIGAAIGIVDTQHACGGAYHYRQRPLTTLRYLYNCTIPARTPSGV
jgi:hypothetical protein